MVKHNKKSYKKHKKPFKNLIKKTKNKLTDQKKKTNFKYIQRGKEMEDYHRRQRAIEEKYRAEANNFILKQQLTNIQDILSDDEEEQNAFEQLVAQLPNKSNTEEYDEENEEEIQSGEESDDSSEMDEEVVSNDSDEIKSDNNINEQLEEELESSDIEEGAPNTTNDPFSKHLDYEATSEDVEKLLAVKPLSKIVNLQWPTLGKVNFEICLQNSIDNASHGTTTETIEKFVPKELSTDDLKEFGLKKSIIEHATLPLTNLQSELLAIIAQYHDIYYPQRTHENGEEVRYVYCMHMINHMMKTRTRILNNNAKLAALAKTKKTNKTDLIVSDSFRDQGLVRPKILVIVPFRDSALRIANILVDLLFGKQTDRSKIKSSLINFERFVSEYSGNTLYFPKTNPKPVDYEQTFSGNTDDNFRIGIALTKKSIKFYTEFYASDIIIASPLALRLVIAGQSDSNERDFDFLNSIEQLIIDQAELLLAQNWENLLHVMEHMHLQPQSLRDTNFQRVRQWYLSGFAKFYRQTLLFSSHELPEFRALFSKKCSNYAGKVRIQNPLDLGSMRNVIIPITQTFQRINVASLATMFDERFDYFVQKVLPRFKNPSFAHCMIYVPSYFDYVRIRNYFRKETINFVQICEYSEKGKIAKARDMFFHSGAHFLLYSERGHFFRRTRIKGIRHLIMYQPPTWPYFYSEMINLMHEANQNNRDGLNDSMSITVMYTKYDMLQLCNIIGTENAAKIVNSTKTIHAFANQ